jgi:hypothetical protein
MAPRIDHHIDSWLPHLRDGALKRLDGYVAPHVDLQHGPQRSQLNAPPKETGLISVVWIVAMAAQHHWR